jgi:hypothetical protein
MSKSLEVRGGPGGPAHPYRWRSMVEFRFNVSLGGRGSGRP